MMEVTIKVPSFVKRKNLTKAQIQNRLLTRSLFSKDILPEYKMKVAFYTRTPQGISLYGIDFGVNLEKGDVVYLVCEDESIPNTNLVTEAKVLKHSTYYTSVYDWTSQLDIELVSSEYLASEMVAFRFNKKYEKRKL